jgi:diguanylate cyclase (GGDEF)-like protein
LVVKDATGDERFCDNPLVCGDPNIRFYAGYPLSAPDGSKIGTLCVIDRQPRDMGNEDLRLLRELGRMVEEELVAASMSTSDGLTGLSNGLGFDLVAGHLLAMCKRMEAPASLLVFNLSNLRDIELSHGNEAAERAIVELSHLVQSSFRDSDIVARLATDPFGILLAGANLDSADRGRARLTELLREHNSNNSDAFDLEICIEVAAYHPGRHANPQALVEEVAKRMAKPADVDEEPKHRGSVAAR